MATESVIYPIIQPKQKVFLEDDTKYHLMGGAKGGGKSMGCRIKAILTSYEFPGARGLVVRRTLPEIRENMIIPLQRELPQDIYSYNGSEHIMTFGNGSTIRFGYCQNFKDVLQYQGIEYDWICIEELTQWREEEWRVLMGCLRSTRIKIRPFFFGSANPGGIGHGWVKRLFINRRFTEFEDPSEYSITRATVYDNPILLRENPEYLKSLQSLPEKLRRAYLDGDWDIFEGQYFTDYRDTVHVCKPFYPVNVKRRAMAIDYGHAAPACALWGAQDTQGKVYIYRELYGKGMLYSQLAQRAAALTGEGEVMSAILVDPAALEKENEATGTTFKAELERAGFRNIKKANNDRIAGWNTVRKYLQPKKDPNTGEEIADLIIGRNCENLVRTLPEMIHDQTNPEDLDTKTEDHAVDTLRYLLMEFGIIIGSMSDVAQINDALTKGNMFEANPLKREVERRKKSSHSIMDKRF